MYNKYNNDQFAIRIYWNGADKAEVVLCKSENAAEAAARRINESGRGRAKVILLDNAN